VYPADEVEAIGRWALERGLWVVTDEIYEHLVYGDADVHVDAGSGAELAERCVVVNGVAKTYAMTGWRVGWLIDRVAVIKAATNLQSHATSNVGNVSQAAALAAVSGDLSAVAEMRTAFDRRRRTIVAMLNESTGSPVRSRTARSTRTPRSSVHWALGARSAPADVGGAVRAGAGGGRGRDGAG
jgi:aspartate/methionine/tyrosine aminotransferase